MSTFKRPGDKTYSFRFNFEGKVHSRNTETANKKEADAIEAKARAQAKADKAEQKRIGEGPLLIAYAGGRYMDEVGDHHKDSKATHRDLQRLAKYFGANKRMDEISDADVSAMIAWRRAQTLKGRKPKDGKPVPTVSNSTINRSMTEVLKKLFTRARVTWRYQFPKEPIWRSHRLKEPKAIVRELDVSEEIALEDSMRGDYAPWVQFALLTGLRRAETLITWDNVNWSTKTITTIGKAGRTVKTAITPDVAALLEPLRGHHEEAVFTFTAERTGRDRWGHIKIKGQRYPITYEGGKTEWQRLAKRAGVKKFRFHDLRHTTATRMLRETGNLVTVQKQLNHADIATTAKYAHVLDAEVADAGQRVSERAKLAREKLRERLHAETQAAE